MKAKSLVSYWKKMVIASSKIAVATQIHEHRRLSPFLSLGFEEVCYNQIVDWYPFYTWVKVWVPSTVYSEWSHLRQLLLKAILPVISLHLSHTERQHLKAK